MKRPFLFLILLLGAGALAFPATAATRSGQKLGYNRDIRPILSENCFQCHGPDSASRKAGLRLDREDESTLARKGGSAAIVKGNPSKSLVYSRLTTKDEDDVMPPPETHKKLTPKQVEMIRRWIADGANYEPHWSFLPPQKGSLPKVKNARWVRTAIDQFILADLERNGLKPAPEADRRTLARRVSLDLTGLPPAPADVEAFVNDKASDAYEKYVERLMNTKDWGEHRARYWLDAARYADTHGIHFDNFREVWAFREWVINAFNRNMPFDQFTVEQLAGDLLPHPSLEQQVASGFNRCNITTSEGGSIAEEYLVLYARDRTETTSQVWLGLTTGCAVCHDHKFDPVTQKEFYQLSAFFNNTTQPAMDGNSKDTPPIVPVPAVNDRVRWTALQAELPAAKAAVAQRRTAARADFQTWLSSAKPETFAASVPSKELVLHLPLNEGTGAVVKAEISGVAAPVTVATNLAWEAGHVAALGCKVIDGQTVALADAGNFEKNQPFSAAAWVKLPNKPNGSILSRMDDKETFRGWDLWVEEGRIGMHIVNKWPDDAIKAVSKNPAKPGVWTHLAVTYDGSGKVGGIKVYIDGQVQETTPFGSELKGTIVTQVPFKVGQRNTTSRVTNAVVQDVRLYSRALPPAEVDGVGTGTRLAWLAQRGGQQTGAEKDELYAWWLPRLDVPFKEGTQKVAALEREDAAIRSRGTIAHIMTEKPEAAGAFVLFRGEYDKRRDPVVAGTPKALPPMPAEAPKNRIGFAQWLLRPEHPLTARVTVNRFWQELFGTGIVRTSGDFGITGELASNQALLDWLAVDFRESGWDIKRFYRLLVTSSAYRQSAVVTAEKLKKDPANRLLSRGPRFRMDAEMVRDYALAASGLLQSKVGGPSVKPYQPDGVWEAVAMLGSNTRDYKRDAGESLYRRSLYTFWKRSAPPASMDIFNAPSREVCAVRRERTNTPLQALVTMNDPQFVEAARVLASQAIRAGTQPEERINFMAQRLAARALAPKELKVVEGTLNDFLKHYQANPKEAEALVAIGESKVEASTDKGTLAAWTMVANELMNLDEVLNK